MNGCDSPIEIPGIFLEIGISVIVNNIQFDAAQNQNSFQPARNGYKILEKPVAGRAGHPAPMIGERDRFQPHLRGVADHFKNCVVCVRRRYCMCVQISNNVHFSSWQGASAAP